MKPATITILLAAVFCGAFAVNRQFAAALAQSLPSDDPVETHWEELPEPVAPAAGRWTSFVPRKPAATPAPALVARFEVRDAHGALVDEVELERRGPCVRASRGTDGSGWFFQQNPIDPAQFKAWRVDPSQALIVEHGHSDVINEGIARSWDEVASLGVDADLLATLAPTGEHELRHGAQFSRHVAGAQARHAVREVWWNAELQLASRIVRGEGAHQHAQVLVALEGEPDPERLRLPAERHPSFRLADLADWREDCHGHASGPVASAQHACADEHR